MFKTPHGLIAAFLFPILLASVVFITYSWNPSDDRGLMLIFAVLSTIFLGNYFVNYFIKAVKGLPRETKFDEFCGGQRYKVLWRGSIIETYDKNTSFQETLLLAAGPYPETRLVLIESGLPDYFVVNAEGKWTTLTGAQFSES